MLEQLFIKNFAIINEENIHFKKGFNVLSGETGAGKSILIDALGLLLGDRAESGLVRTGQARAEVQAIYQIENKKIQQFLDQHELDNEEENSCQLRRTLQENGKSRAYINGLPVTLLQLKTLGEKLTNIHGQHAHQFLTVAERQCECLDQFGGYHDLLQKTRDRYTAWQKLLKQKQSLSAGDGLLARIELLNYQVAEL